MPAHGRVRERAFTFFLLKIIGSPTKWVWRAGKKKRESEGNEFLLAHSVWRWKRWAGFLPVRAEILAQKRFELRPVIATIRPLGPLYYFISLFLK